jgi:hypothetical protein
MAAPVPASNMSSAARRHTLPGMDLKDATLMILNESAAHPRVAKIAQAAYDRLADGQEVDYRVLDELVGEARVCSVPSGRSTVPRPTRPYSRPFSVRSTGRNPSRRAGGRNQFRGPGCCRRQ